MASPTEQPPSEEPKPSLQNKVDPSSGPSDDETDFADSNLAPARFWTLSLG